MLKECVYGNPSSPYLPLLRRAQCAYEDLAGQVAREGVEATLSDLHAADVWISLDEFKGRKPLVRGDLEVPVTAESFDNPRTAGSCPVSSGGSTGRPVRTNLSLDNEAAKAVYEHVILQMLGLHGMPVALWYPQLPAGTGIGNSLRYAKVGEPPARWFDLGPEQNDVGAWQGRLMTAGLILASRFSRTPLAGPERTGHGR